MRFPALGLLALVTLICFNLGCVVYKRLGMGHYFLRGDCGVGNLLFVTLRLCMIFLFGEKNNVQERFNIKNRLVKSTCAIFLVLCKFFRRFCRAGFVLK